MVHGAARARRSCSSDVILADGHELDEWSLIDERGEPPRPVEEYDAVLVFGGHMNVDEEQRASVAARRGRA